MIKFIQRFVFRLKILFALFGLVVFGWVFPLIIILSLGGDLRKEYSYILITFKVLWEALLKGGWGDEIHHRRR